MLFKKSLVVSSLIIVFLQAIECANFVKQSTVTNIISKDFDEIKSIETKTMGGLE